MSNSGTDSISLSVSGLTGRLSDQFALGPISFDVRAGYHLGVIGLSGSGKSTLLRILALFVTADTGSIQTPVSYISFAENTYVRNQSLILRHRRYLGYVAQQNSLWPHLTVQENVELGLRHVLKLSSVERHRRSAQLLGQLSLSHLASRKVWEISGGEARRTAVARALALQPRVLLLDEPDTGLDPLRSQQQMKLILATCEEKGATAIIVSHNPAVIEECARTVIVLDGGQQVESGDTQLVLEQPRAEITTNIVRSAGWMRRGEVGEWRPGKL